MTQASFEKCRRIVNVAVRIGHRDGLRAQFVEFFHRVLGHVAGAGHQANLALQIVVAGGEHVLGEVHAAVAGGFRTDEEPPQFRLLPVRTPVNSLRILLYWPKGGRSCGRPTPMSPAGTSVSAPMWRWFRHEALAEVHHFIIALALGVEVGASLAAAHGQGGEGVLENLFKAQELQNAEVHAGVEAEAALVRPDGAV